MTIRVVPDIQGVTGSKAQNRGPQERGDAGIAAGAHMHVQNHTRGFFEACPGQIEGRNGLLSLMRFQNRFETLMKDPGS